MTQLVFKRSGGSNVSVVVHLEKKALKFDMKQLAVVNVKGPAYFGLGWFVKGPATARWSLELIAPAAIAFKIEKSLPPDGKDNNSDWLFVP